MRKDRTLELSGGRKRTESKHVEHCNKAKATNAYKHSDFIFTPDALVSIAQLRRQFRATARLLVIFAEDTREPEVGRFRLLDSCAQFVDGIVCIGERRSRLVIGLAVEIEAIQAIMTCRLLCVSLFGLSRNIYVSCVRSKRGEQN